MQLCYVDESGKAETLEKGQSQQQPVFVIAGISIPEDRLTQITHEWIELKRRFNPGMAARNQKGWLDGILLDLKGSTLRRGFRKRGSVRQRKRAIGLIDGTLKLLERHQGRIIGRVWVKKVDEPNDAMKTYASSLQFICACFHAGLPEDERGMVIVDSQTHKHNHQLAHSMFTQRFGRNPPYERLVDMPVFGHSDNHAGLQIADLLCSAVLAPIACSVYAGAYERWNSHCDPRFLDLREEFGERLHRLTYDWHNAKTGNDSSSVVVNDPISKRSTVLLWGPRAPKPPKRKSPGKFSSPSRPRRAGPRRSVSR